MASDENVESAHGSTPQPVGWWPEPDTLGWVGRSELPEPEETNPAREDEREPRNGTSGPE